MNNYNYDNGHCWQLNSRRAESQELRSAEWAFAILQYCILGFHVNNVLILVLILMWWISTEQVLLQLDDTHWSERLLQRLESEHKRSFACVYIVKYHQHAQWASTYQGSRVTITISITGWQLELGPAGKLCSGSLELYNVVEIMCSKCDLCLGHNVQCPRIRFQAKLMYCIFPLRRRLCTLEEENEL